MARECSISELIWKTPKSIEVARSKDLITFKFTDGSVYSMYHHQECCEYVRIEDICGDLELLVGSPIIDAFESTNEGDMGDLPEPTYDESRTWTFYRIRGAKETVVIRWLGESNGYYSESVDLECDWEPTKEVNR